MTIASFAPAGFEGNIVSVEVDIRRGIPGVEIVGLPDGAVREARERVRIAVRNSGFQFPRDRVVINLAPAGLRKEGASFDLPIAAAVLSQSGQIPDVGCERVLVLGELELSGAVRGVAGCLSAVAAAGERGIGRFVVPHENVAEASALGTRGVYGVGSLAECVDVLQRLAHGVPPPEGAVIASRTGMSSPAGKTVAPGALSSAGTDLCAGDFSDIRGQTRLRRAMEIAAAGRHHLFLFGPPGSGKTMAARRFPTVLPDLSRTEGLEVTRIHSMAGTLPAGGGMVRRPPFRMPHHSASREGLIGGGRTVRPGEVSLAHNGVLFLDEAPEFPKNLLQALREPIEEGRVDIARAGVTLWYPADFQLILAANPCPCGNLGKEDAVCLCAEVEIARYWRRIGGALLDRVDVRVPCKPAASEEILGGPGESSRSVRRRVAEAIVRQEHRFRGAAFSRNARIPPGALPAVCRLDSATETIFVAAIRKLSLSSRASHSVLKVSRTIADLDASDRIQERHLLEALQHRRFGDAQAFGND